MALTLKMQIALNNDYKNNNGRNFQFKKKIIVLTIEGVFQIHGQSRPVTNLPAVDSHSGIFQCFSRHNSRNLRHTTCIENREDFAVHSLT